MKGKNLFPLAVSVFMLISILVCSTVSMAEPINYNNAQPATTATNLSNSLNINPMASSLSSAVISAVQSGTTNTSTITSGPSPDPIGQNITIDIRIDNVSVGFWGWFLPTIIWDTAVMNLTKVQPGPFLSDNNGGDPTTFFGASKTLWYNFVDNQGTISGGLSEAINFADTSIDSSGVLATLTFLLTGPGNTNITIAEGNLRASRSDTTGTNITCNSVTINVLSNNPKPTPTPTPTQTSLSPSPTVTQTPTSPPASQSNTPTPTQTTSVPEFPSWIIIVAITLPLITTVANLWKKKVTTQQIK